MLTAAQHLLFYHKSRSGLLVYKTLRSHWFTLAVVCVHRRRDPALVCHSNLLTAKRGIPAARRGILFLVIAQLSENRAEKSIIFCSKQPRGQREHKLAFNLSLQPLWALLCCRIVCVGIFLRLRSDGPTSSYVNQIKPVWQLHCFAAKDTFVARRNSLATPATENKTVMMKCSTDSQPAGWRALSPFLQTLLGCTVSCRGHCLQKPAGNRS